MRRLAALSALSVVLINGCAAPGLITPAIQTKAPESVRRAALAYAHKYAECGTIYGWGSQDPLPGRTAVDCSGLVVRCYQYACDDFGYSLCFSDATAAGMLDFSIPGPPEPGDLVFMGESSVVSHIAIFDHEEDGTVFFVDSTENGNVNGVTLRSYRSTNSKFISFGRMVVRISK